MALLARLKRVLRHGVFVREKVGSLHLYFNPEHDPIARDYYLYVVTLMRLAAAGCGKVGDVVFGSYPYAVKGGRSLLRIDFQIEHTLVKPGGRGAEHARPGAVPISGASGERYLVRVQDEVRLNHADAIVEYSRANHINITRGGLHTEIAARLFYIAPLVYPIHPIPGEQAREFELITLFGNPDEPRRKKFLEQLKSLNPQARNVNGQFEKVRSVYERTRILINIRQTDHHDTLEELRVLPALLSGVVVISEDVPLRHEIPYRDFVLWAPLSEIPQLAAEVRGNYAAIHQRIFGGDALRLCLENMANENAQAAQRMLARLG